MELGYAPGGNLRRQLTGLGYSFDLLLRTGLVGNQGRDAFCRRLIFPLRQQGRVINLYGRSIGGAFPVGSQNLRLTKSSAATRVIF